jgi:hypothetical protein
MVMVMVMAGLELPVIVHLEHAVIVRPKCAVLVVVEQVLPLVAPMALLVDVGLEVPAVPVVAPMLTLMLIVQSQLLMFFSC